MNEINKINFSNPVFGANNVEKPSPEDKPEIPVFNGKGAPNEEPDSVKMDDQPQKLAGNSKVGYYSFGDDPEQAVKITSLKNATELVFGEAYLPGKNKNNYSIKSITGNITLKGDANKLLNHYFMEQEGNFLQLVNREIQKSVSKGESPDKDELTTFIKNLCRQAGYTLDKGKDYAPNMSVSVDGVGKGETPDKKQISTGNRNNKPAGHIPFQTITPPITSSKRN